MTLKDCSHSQFLRSRKSFRFCPMLSTLCTICWALTLKRFILASVAWTRGWQTFSVTCQIVNIFGFVYGLGGNCSALPLLHESHRRQYTHADRLCWVPIQLCLGKCVAGWIWPSGRSFLTPQMVCGHQLWVDLPVPSCV